MAKGYWVSAYRTISDPEKLNLGAGSRGWTIARTCAREYARRDCCRHHPRCAGLGSPAYGGVTLAYVAARPWVAEHGR